MADPQSAPERARHANRLIGTVFLFTGAALFSAGVVLLLVASGAHGGSRSTLFLVGGVCLFFGVGDLAYSRWARRRASN